MYLFLTYNFKFIPSFINFIYLFIYLFCHTTWHAGSQIPDQDQAHAACSGSLES